MWWGSERSGPSRRVGETVRNMNKSGTTTMLVAILCVAGYVRAQTPVDVVQTWTDPDTAGWTNDVTQTTLSNPGGYLNMRFPDQTMPGFQADTMRMAAIPNTLLTNISFRFLSADIDPSAVRLCLHSSRSDNYWYVPLSNPPQGEWTTFNVPVDLSLANWIMAPVNSDDQFRKDMVCVDWVGVYVLRRGDIAAQNYAIDDFRIQGVTIPSSVSISGAVSYDGEQQETGVIHVNAVSTRRSSSTAMAGTGSYQIGGLDLGTDYTMSAYRDSNNNNVQDLWEPSGTWTGNPARVYLSDLTGVDIAMGDPTSADGLPYWWLNRYFGVTEPGGEGGGNGQSFADIDSDGDGMRNYGEYRAGTDPTNCLSRLAVEIALVDKGGGLKSLVIRWGAVEKHSYAVWRSEALISGFTRIESGIAATPPLNEYEDVTATNRVPYYYKVQVE
jgi:hypothetical protein